jgi:hypothetical protein
MRTAVPRIVYFNLQGYTDFFGNSGTAGAPLLQCRGLPHANGVAVGTANLLAPRCDPLNQIIQQLQININGQIVSSNTGQYATVIQRFNTERDEREYDLSMSPMMQDNSLNYADDFMADSSPLGSTQDNVFQLPRGSFNQVTVTSNTSNGNNTDTGRIYWNYTTPIILSPFCYSRNYQEKLAFLQLSQLELTFTFGGKGSNAIAGLSGGLWSWTAAVPTGAQTFPWAAPYAGGPTISAAQTTIPQGGATLYNQFLYPPIWQSIPRSLYYAYTVPTWLPNAQPVINAGLSRQIMSQAIQRNQTPADIIVRVAEQMSDFDMTKSDVPCFAITACVAQWDSGAPALSTLSQYDLYQSLYVTKGGTMSWREWSGQTGAPGQPAVYDSAVGQSGTGIKGSYLRITPGIDIPLPSGDAPSCSMQKHTLLLTITVTNLTSRDIIPSVDVLILDEGVFKIDEGIASQQSNLITPGEVKSLEHSNNNPIPYYVPKSVLGGNFLHDIGSFFKKAVRPLITVAQKLVPAQYQPVVTAADTIAKSYGLGKLGLGRMKGKKKKVRGGSMLTQEQLENLALTDSE